MESEQSVDALSGLKIVVLNPKQHDRKSFDCGIETLNKYLREVAREHASKGISKTYIATYNGISIVGYYTIVPKGVVDLGESSVSAVLIGKLATDSRYQGRGIGRYMLLSAAYDSQIIAAENGAVLLKVDALKETGSPSFYKKFGFEELDDQERTIVMYMTIRDILALGLENPKEE